MSSGAANSMRPEVKSKKSLASFQFGRGNNSYEEYLMAMKRIHRRSKIKDKLLQEVSSPRERRRRRHSCAPATNGSGSMTGGYLTAQEATRISIIASMVPDEIILEHSDYSVRSYDTALMFIDVSGFTDLCEIYTKTSRGGPSRLSQVLNTYIGAMVQEILTHDGDVLKFAGDAFLSMWKKTPKLTMQHVVHTAIDCGIAIQKNYGSYTTDVGIELKVKIAISAGVSHFCIIGGDDIPQSHYIVVGQPVWDVKIAEYMSTAGDVLTSASAWTYVNETEYCTQPCGDGRHTKVLGVGATWKRVKRPDSTLEVGKDYNPWPSTSGEVGLPSGINYWEFSLRPAVVAAIRSSWCRALRPFMATPVLRAIDNDEPMDFLTEVRRVVIVFLNIVTLPATEDVLLKHVNTAFKKICSVTSEAGGLVNSVSMFDKDTMILIVFGLRGLKHEDEARKALQCAHQLKEKLVNPNFISVSIGVTSGKTYCGVLGHVLRREYTVIGSAVNKAARLMMAYSSKVTCDKETFLRSKLDKDYFRLMPAKSLKGIGKPGPIYEFNIMGWPERQICSRPPILGREEELRKYNEILDNAVKQQHQKFTRYRDHKCGVAIMGPKLIGKTRLMEECINLTPSLVRVQKACFNKTDKVPFKLIRFIINRVMVPESLPLIREQYESGIRRSLDLSILTAKQIYAINYIFDCGFPLPENYEYIGDIISEYSVKTLLQEICRRVFPSLNVVAIEEAQHIDDESWRVLWIFLETKKIFIIMTINTDEERSTIANQCLSTNMIVKFHLTGIDRWYHAALACQLLDVQAIPADLEKVIQSASGGIPGWIQNFVISLVQLGELTVVTTGRNEAIESGAVVPACDLLQRPAQEFEDRKFSHNNISILNSGTSGVTVSKQESVQLTMPESEPIQMAVLAESYNFEDMKVDMTMDSESTRLIILKPFKIRDSIILKTYDSLTPFEKMVLKCGSVIGDIFSRRMLRHLLTDISPRKLALAVAKLFSIRVLECEGGDFTYDTSLVLVHPAPALPEAKPPYCSCLGTRQPPNCRDLPIYAFCGYMKFKHSTFRITTYDLLTDGQKHEMHARALLYYERYTRRCIACGSGCFTKLLGLRCDDGLAVENKELAKARRQIWAFCEETRVPGEDAYTSPFHIESDYQLPVRASNYLAETLQKWMKRVDVQRSEQSGPHNVALFDGRIPIRNPSANMLSEELRRFRKSMQIYRKDTRVRSFSSLELTNCECLNILMSVYSQIIEHCRVAGENEKLFEAYLEYADLSVLNLNVPQAIRLLFEVETLVTSDCFEGKHSMHWLKDYRLARIHSLRGACMLEYRDLVEAKQQLFRAMELYSDPFPTSKHWVRFRSMRSSLHQTIALYIAPQLYVASETGTFNGTFYEDIAGTLNLLYRLFTECKDVENATLAAKWSLNYALKTDSNFRILCISYGNMIVSYRTKQQFSKCLKLEKRAMELCHRKRGQIDVTEVHAVCFLYTSIFMFYVEYGKKVESLEFGVPVMHMMTKLTDLTTRQMLVMSMLKLLLADSRIEEVVTIMRELFYMSDHYDLSSETWYYYFSIVILLDTGYCVESYEASERFYTKRGDAILRSNTPESAWNFFVGMWLVTVRTEAWERSIMWEEKIKHLLFMKFERHEFNAMLLLRLVEGLLITLVREMDNGNVKKIGVLEKTVKNMFQDIKNAVAVAPIYRPRNYLLVAYFHFIRGKKLRAFSYLNKASTLAKRFGHAVLLTWTEHTRCHWKGKLSPVLENYWADHVEFDNVPDYREFDKNKNSIIPYTLPLPRDLDH